MPHAYNLRTNTKWRSCMIQSPLFWFWKHVAALLSKVKNASKASQKRIFGEWYCSQHCFSGYVCKMWCTRKSATSAWRAFCLRHYLLECINHRVYSARAWPWSIKLFQTNRKWGSFKQIHDQIRSQNFIEKDIVLDNALVYMYAECGMLDKAQKALEVHSNRNVITWSAIISGYA